MTLRDRVRDAAAEAGIAIEHVANGHVRKEAIVAEVPERRGDHPGLVHVAATATAGRRGNRPLPASAPPGPAAPSRGQVPGLDPATGSARGNG